jgi:hypothetical protein
MDIVCSETRTEIRLCRTIRNRLGHADYHLQSAMFGGYLERFVGVVNIIECELWTLY